MRARGVIHLALLPLVTVTVFKAILAESVDEKLVFFLAAHGFAVASLFLAAFNSLSLALAGSLASTLALAYTVYTTLGYLPSNQTILSAAKTSYLALLTAAALVYFKKRIQELRELLRVERK